MAQAAFTLGIVCVCMLNVKIHLHTKFRQRSLISGRDIIIYGL